jgi:hypothetical protein
MEEYKRYTHDCTRCIFLGQFKDADLYYCDQLSTSRSGRLTKDPTIVARYSNEPSDYSSGIPRLISYPELAEGYNRAVARKLIK